MTEEEARRWNAQRDAAPVALDLLRTEKAEMEAAFMYFMNMVSNVLTDSQLDQRTKCGETVRIAYGRYWNMYFRKDEEHDLAKLEAAVADAKAIYTKERDARRPADHLWNEYARLLHALRLRKRSMNHG